jgi:hypothetical protein
VSKGVLATATVNRASRMEPPAEPGWVCVSGDVYGQVRNKLPHAMNKIAPSSDFDLELSDTISIALETNGKGYMGFLVDLPGAFVRGKDEEEALSKVRQEAKSYLDWLGILRVAPTKWQVVQRHHCQLMVEDADGEILLDADRGTLPEEEFQTLAKLVHRSARTFKSLYDTSALKHWVDPSRARRTFYGERPKTIQEVFDHVNATQHYYFSRAGLPPRKEETDFLATRELYTNEIERLFRSQGNSRVYDVDNELWTLKKILRRFVWHDRIHGKAITKILAKQKRLGLIESYEDSFGFALPV